MDSINWNKIENESGYPCYVDKSTGKQQYDHPQFTNIMAKLEEYKGIKYNVYRIAFKIVALQKILRVPPVYITSGVFARHQLSMSESSLSLDTAELESVLADIYFAAEKDGCFDGDIDLTVDLLINLLLNVYDKERKEPIRVLAVKTMLIILSDEPLAAKWAALSQCCADHNGCVSPRRLAVLLTCMSALPQCLGDQCGQVQADVDACFAKSAGMLGVTACGVCQWGEAECSSARWLAVVTRLRNALTKPNAQSGCCSACSQPFNQGLKFKCSKCTQIYFCDKCYLYDRDLTKIGRHKKTHLVYEIVDGEIRPSECLSFIKGMGQFFFCTKRKKKVNKKVLKKAADQVDGGGTLRKKKNGKPAIFTSTVGKASGNNANNPTSMLQDIIMQLEAQNKILKERILKEIISTDKADKSEDGVRLTVEAHWRQISAQINRLKILKENMMLSPLEAPPEIPNTDTKERPQAFDLFSPIAQVDDKQSKVPDIKNQPRVLSLDSGNFSVVSSKQTDSQNLLTMSGDAMKPVVANHTTDTISTVSMNDISSWYNEPESTAPDKRLQSHSRVHPPDVTSQSIRATEKRFDADIRSVETSNDKMKELNADLDTVLDRLQQILSNNFAMDESCYDNNQLRETANEMEGLLGTLIRGVEQRATLNKGLV